MKTLHQIAKENGFKYWKVSVEEHEDGVGACVGDNWIKDQKPYPVWYTTVQMIEELELPILQVKTANLDASQITKEEAKQMMIEWLEKQGAVWYDIYRLKYGFSGSAVCIAAYYGTH